MTKMDKLLQIFAKKPDTSIEDAMRRTGASRPMVYKARKEAEAHWREIQPGINALAREEFQAADQITSTLAERGEKYGLFIGHAEVTRALKNVIHFYCVERKGSFQNIDPDMAEALDMIAHKMGRIINGDHTYADSWIDIAGYAKLVADRLQGAIR